MGRPRMAILPISLAQYLSKSRLSGSYKFIIQRSARSGPPLKRISSRDKLPRMREI